MPIEALMDLHYDVFSCPHALGRLVALEGDGALRALLFIKKGGIKAALAEAAAGTPSLGETPLLIETFRQIDAYFRGRLRAFDLPLAPQGTLFQRAAWEALGRIPFGETRTYGEQALAMGRSKAARAVGGANRANPLVVVLPCHRVIGRDGSLTGFGAGLHRKAWLLAHEARCLGVEGRLCPRQAASSRGA
jgi:methylated-DNA-[protein]-cysteine S-methyltransferase